MRLFQPLHCHTHHWFGESFPLIIRSNRHPMDLSPLLPSPIRLPPGGSRSDLFALTRDQKKTPILHNFKIPTELSIGKLIVNVKKLFGSSLNPCPDVSFIGAVGTNTDPWGEREFWNPIHVLTDHCKTVVFHRFPCRGRHDKRASSQMFIRHITRSHFLHTKCEPWQLQPNRRTQIY